MTTLRLGKKLVGLEHPTFVVADIAANYDGSLERAKLLIRLCAEAGANAAKFQNFRARTLVSDRGFQTLGQQVSHQAGWKKSVFQVYDAAALPWEWTPILKQECEANGIDYFSAPYDLDAVDMSIHVEFTKSARGTSLGRKSCARWHKSKNRRCWPTVLRTWRTYRGPSKKSCKSIRSSSCCSAIQTTPEAWKLPPHSSRVLQSYRTMFPSAVLGLSDHTPGHVTVLGAVALGARVIEKHFTDDNRREGVDARSP